MPRTPKAPKTIAALKHPEAKRKNIPTAEYQSVMQEEQKAPVKVSYPRKAKGLEQEKDQRNRDLDPQLVWRGKDQQDWSDLVVNAPPLYIQEKVKPKVLIDDLLKESSRGEAQQAGGMADLFGDFNGFPKDADKTDFYHYEGNWQNRMILGDSLQVMASLAEREGLRGKVQCIYLDPPYGIKFNSNFQWSTTSRDVKDGNADHITREPEQVKAFRDTWRDGIHSYLTYLRDRLTVARDLLTESGSIFVQIGDENVHHVRELMDEVFGNSQFVSLIPFRKRSMAFTTHTLPKMMDYLVWYCKDITQVKFRSLFVRKEVTEDNEFAFIEDERHQDGFRRMTAEERENVRFLESSKDRIFKRLDLCASGYGKSTDFPIAVNGRTYTPRSGVSWKTNEAGIQRLLGRGRLFGLSGSIYYKIYYNDFPYQRLANIWTDTRGEVNKTYVVQTSESIVSRCVLMATDPGDLVLDPTCGSGTTAYVAEQWGRRWITIDTSRVALALARARIMGARYPYYLLADSKEGQLKEAEVTRSMPKTTATWGNISLGFVYERVPHVTLGSIASNTETDVIWDRFESMLAPVRDKLTNAMPKDWSRSIATRGNA